MKLETKSLVADLQSRPRAETAVAAAPVAPAPQAVVPEVPVAPVPDPVVAPVALVEMSHSQFMAKCKELMGVECIEGCAYEADGKMVFQPVVVAGDQVTKGGEPMEIVKPVAGVPAEVPPPAEAPAAAVAATAELVSLRAQVAAFQAVEATRDAADRDAVLARAGVKPDMADLAVANLARVEGQSWAEAVNALVAARPSMFAKPETVSRSAGKLPLQASAPKASTSATGVKAVRGFDYESKIAN